MPGRFVFIDNPPKRNSMKLRKAISVGYLVMILTVGCGSDDGAFRYDVDSLGGVWMSFKAGSGFDNVKWIVFDGEGYIIDDLPRMGLYEITEGDLSNYTLGTYSVNGHNVQASTAYTNYTFNWADINTLTREGHTYKFYRCTVKDNMRLNGSWTTYSNTSDPYLDQDGARPVLILNADGTFTDRGLWVTNFTDPYANAEAAPGNGTYQILNYTLILTYSDGRVRKRSFTGTVNQDPSHQADLLYIGSNPVHKR